LALNYLLWKDYFWNLSDCSYLYWRQIRHIFWRYFCFCK